MVTIDVTTMSIRELEALAQDISVELQEREYKVKDILSREKRMWRMDDNSEVDYRVMESYTNEAIFENALTMGLTPDDPDVIEGGYSEDFADYIAQKEIIQSRRTTGA